MSTTAVRETVKEKEESRPYAEIKRRTEGLLEKMERRDRFP